MTRWLSSTVTGPAESASNMHWATAVYAPGSQSVKSLLQLPLPSVGTKVQLGVGPSMATCVQACRVLVPLTLTVTLPVPCSSLNAFEIRTWSPTNSSFGAPSNGVG